MIKIVLLSVLLFSVSVQAQYAKLPVKGPLPTFRPTITVEEEVYVFENDFEEDFYLNLSESALHIDIESLHLGYHKTGKKKVYLSLDMIILVEGKSLLRPIVQTEVVELSQRGKVKLKNTRLKLDQDSILKVLTPYADSLDENFKPRFFISLHQVGILRAKTSPIFRTPIVADNRLYPLKSKVVDQVHNLGAKAYIYPEVKFSASFE
jgi:hypothetical protein